MIILVDVDGPLADFYGEFLKHWKEKYPNFPVVEKEDRKFFDLKDEYPKEYAERAKEIYTAPGFAESLPVNKEGIRAIQNMSASGHSIFLCTSPLSHYDPNVVEKYRWIEKYLGREYIQKIITTRDKTLIQGDVLIDDKPEISGLLKPTWKRIVFDMPYNRYLTSPRLKEDWSNWEELLLRN